MKVKCIGGPNDGEWHDIRNDTRINQLVPIYEKPKLASITKPFNVNEPPVAFTNRNYYILKCLHGPRKETFKYLISENEDEWYCLASQLEGRVIKDYDKIDKLFKLRFGISFNEWLKTHERVMQNVKSP